MGPGYAESGEYRNTGLVRPLSSQGTISIRRIRLTATLHANPKPRGCSQPGIGAAGDASARDVSAFMTAAIHPASRRPPGHASRALALHAYGVETPEPRPVGRTVIWTRSVVSSPEATQHSWTRRNLFIHRRISSISGLGRSHRLYFSEADSRRAGIDH